MTVAELYAQTAQLGFEGALESDERFYFAANRALLQVNDLRPQRRSLLLNHRPLPNATEGACIYAQDKVDELIFEASDPKGFYFECDGIGTALIKWQGPSGWEQIGAVELQCDGGFCAYRGLIKRGDEFVNGRVRLIFKGEYLYSVRLVGLYPFLTGPDVEKIPAPTAFLHYDLSTLANDFLSLAPLPFLENDEGERITDGYSVENGRILLLSRELRGCFKVHYLRRPAPLIDKGNALNDQIVIELDDDLAALLPELIASYVWAEDEAELAQYYLNLYRARAAEIAIKGESTAPLRVIRKSGW